MIRKITNDRPFKILGFTDTHLDDYADRFEVTLKLMAETVETEKPDLVVFVGDNVTGGDNRARAKTFQKTMTQLKIPWAPVLGNHEGDNPESITREEMMGLFARSPYCMAKAERPVLQDGREVSGDGNYTVELTNEAGEVCHQLIFMDGHSYMAPEDVLRHCPDFTHRRIYDFLKPDQVAWYQEEIAKVDCSSMIFCHIPLPEYWYALVDGKLLSGKTREKICCSFHNSGMFQ